MKLVRASETPTLKNFAYFIPSSEDSLENVIDRVSKAYAKFEGTKIYIFEVDRSHLNLINLSNINVLRNLYSNTMATNSILNSDYDSSDDEKDDNNYGLALKKSFYIKNGEILRNSAPKRDNKVSKYVCGDLKMNGYIANPLIKKFGVEKFHEEVMLCKKGQNKLNFSKTIFENPTVPLKPRREYHKISLPGSPIRKKLKLLKSPPGSPL